ncbi:MAG: YkgJ family cysteine cluster protein [Rhodospirillaceae bacterium]|nr:YkgJ family cysteine cluster protein [Rhodospirillaceae bacterium]MDD9925858.1 YkgJ family cysteine cluster protein [Rhodospirillaceae bacterium]
MADMTMEFHCTACGKCCLEGAGWLPVVEADIARWETSAPHVLRYVAWEGEAGERRGGLSRSVVTGRETTRCPFVRKRRGRAEYYCRIYEVRPQVCRRYPTSPDHALYTGCDGAFVPTGDAT